LVQVMAAPVILILSDSSEESVGVSRVILFGTILTSIHVILVVPAKVSIAPVDPLVASKADSESEPAEQRPKRHESLAPSFKFPLTLVVSPPKIHRWPAILVRPDEAIPFDSSSSGSSLDSSLDISLGSSSDSLSDSSSVHSLRCDASVAPQNFLSLGNEDTIFDPGIFSYHISSFVPDVSH
nr:hypothetical protein [Tanacetum cinerariifolium]